MADEAIETGGGRGKGRARGWRKAEHKRRAGRGLTICAWVILTVVVFLTSRATALPVLRTLARGSFLRVSADISGGLPLDHWKTRSVRHPREGPIEALCAVWTKQGGPCAYWAGLPAKLVEGFCCGGLLLAAKEGTKAALSRVATSARVPLGEAAIGAISGVAGGCAQCLILTPTTFLVMTASATGVDVRETMMQIARGERRATDLYTGGGPLVLREASNWASRQGITDLTRNLLLRQGLRGGVLLEIGSGVLGGVLACWNNPFEVVRIRQQRDLAEVPGPGASTYEVMRFIVATEGPQGLFIGIIPRCCLSAWLTCFMVVAPRFLKF